MLRDLEVDISFIRVTKCCTNKKYTTAICREQKLAKHKKIKQELPVSVMYLPVSAMISAGIN